MVFLREVDHRAKTFQTYWRLHRKWSQGILLKEIQKIPSADIFLGCTPDEYNSFAVPLAKNPNQLDLEGVEKKLSNANRKVSVYLFEKHQKLGFSEHLVRKGYGLSSRDTWMILEQKLFKKGGGGVKITLVTPSSFSDYYQVLSVVFKDYSGNEEYLKICRKSLTGEVKSIIPDLKSELFLIYEGGRPVSGAGLFWSRSLNVAYLHDAGTLEQYRGRGYQTALLEHRVRRTLKRGVTRIYTIVEHGGTSWRNCIRYGFNQSQVTNLFVKK